MDQARSFRVGRIAVIIAALVTIALVGVLAYSFGRLSVRDSVPTDGSAEAGFARDMQVHHNQGVELAMIVRDRTDDPDVRLLAYDIATTQSQQSGQLYGWLTEWGLSQAGREPSMTWMTRPPVADNADDTHMGASTQGQPMTARSMPGLATTAQIAELSAASGIQAERIFLTLMIVHHKGAVEMAEAALDRVVNTSVQGLATAVVKSQTAEMDLMQNMLAART